MNDKRLKKKCLVCGDKAIGNNFDALSCESCKAFFRRINTNTKNKQIKCKLQNKCDINVSTRKSCRKCRLQKCLDIGMKRDWLIPYETIQYVSPQQPILPMDWHKKSSNDNSNGSSDTTSTPMSLSSDSTSSQDSDSYHQWPDSKSNIIEIPDIFDGLLEDLPFNDKEFDTQLKEIEECLDDTTVGNDWPDIGHQSAMELAIPRPHMNHKFSLNELEGNRLLELLNSANFFAETLPNASRVTVVAKNVIHLKQLLSCKVDQQVMRLARMCRILGSFRDICDTDRITLIKQGVLHLFCIRSVPFYDTSDDKWIYHLENNTTVILNLELMRDFPRNLYYYYKNFFHNACSEWESDPVLLDLLTAITLFNPNRPRLLFRHLVKYQQEIYMYLLYRYLQMRYRSEWESKQKYLKLSKCLQDLNDLGDRYLQYCLGKDPDAHTSLMKEVLDKPSTNSSNNYNFMANLLIY